MRAGNAHQGYLLGQLTMDLASFESVADLAARSVALAAAAVAGVVAGTHWAVRRRAIGPFSAWSKGVRRLSDPALRPIEQRLVRAGGNPQDATFWLFGLTVLGGLALIATVRWIVGLVATLIGLTQATPIVWVSVAVDWIFGLLMAALIVRVIASWFGASQHARWLRPFWHATEWLLRPIRRIAPAVGMIDLSPLLAYLALWMARSVVGALIASVG